MFFVYVIRSEKDGRLYKGFTTNLERRLKEHNEGGTKSTKGYIPWELVYFEEANTRSLAREREKYLKSGQGRDYLKEYIKAP